MIEKNGFEILIINFGVMGEPAFAPDITRQEVAKAGGGDLATLASGEYKDEAMRVMAAGPAMVVRRLFADVILEERSSRTPAWRISPPDRVNPSLGREIQPRPTPVKLSLTPREARGVYLSRVG